MFPTLPQADPNPTARQAQLNRSQAHYIFETAYQTETCPQGIGLSATVPYDQQFTLPYQAKALGVDATLLANHAAVDLEYLTGVASHGVNLTDWLGLTRAIGNQHFFLSQPAKAAKRIAHSFPLNLEKYKALFALIPEPEVVGFSSKSQEQIDLGFAWQRLAGVNPVILQGITTIPKTPPPPEWKNGCNGKQILVPPPMGQIPGNFPITNELYQRVMGANDSLEQAAAEHRLYLADYRLMMELPQGKWQDGELGIPRERYLYAPLALFAWQRDSRGKPGEFRPVAIQCHQVSPKKGEANPIFTPLDGYRWQMARTVVQCADGVLQEMVSHLGRTHMVMEAAIVAAYRHLAQAHPILVLLVPHFEFTLALNDYATKHLIAPGGAVDNLFGTTITGSLTALVRGLQEYDFSRAAPPQDLADRCVDDVQGLPTYPYRDDALRVWETIKQFVGRYVHLYYSSDQDVRQDWELQKFIQAFGDTEGGNVRGVPQQVDTLEQLTEVVATLIFTATAQHSALNYAQFPFMGYVPNVPGALYAPAPTADTPQNLLNVLEMLPPVSLAMQQFSILYQLSNIRYSVLGHYPPFHFEDRRVEGLVRKFQSELALAEKAMQADDQYRFMSYPFLFPSAIGNSIFI